MAKNKQQNASNGSNVHGTDNGQNCGKNKTQNCGKNSAQDCGKNKTQNAYDSASDCK